MSSQLPDSHPIVVHKDRRLNAPSRPPGSELRVHCWDLAGCSSEQRDNCYAYFLEQNCWDLWALRSLDRKYCCIKEADCRDCRITKLKFSEPSLPVHVPVKASSSEPPQKRPRGRPPIVLPQTCRYFVIEGTAAAQPHGTDVRALIRSLGRDERDVCRCRHRGVHLEWSYVVDVCASRYHAHCVFLEEKTESYSIPAAHRP